MLHTICFPSQFGCTDEGAPRYAYDPAKAKALLAEAGFPNGFDIELYAYRERNQTEAMIGYLRAVGIKANLRFLQYAAMRDAGPRRQGGADRTRPGARSRSTTSPPRRRSIFKFTPDDISRDRRSATCSSKGDTSVDPEVRKEAYAKALAADRRSAPMRVPLYSLPAYYVGRQGPRSSRPIRTRCRASGR